MTIGPEVIIAGVAGLIAVIVLIIGVVAIRAQRGPGDIEERLGRYTDLEYIDIPEDGSESSQQQFREVAKQVDQALAKRGIGEKWRASLAKADLKITATEYFLIMIGSTLVAFLVGTFVLFQNPIAGLISAVIGFFFPRIYVSRIQNRRLRSFEQQLPDVLGLWVNSLRSGYSVLQAMEAIAKEAPEPSKTEFRRVVQEVQIGISMEDALAHMNERMDSEDLDLIITAVNIQREVGGNLAEILDIIGHTIRERIKLKGEIRVLTSQGRITGYIIGFLPVGLAGLLYMINPGYMGGLFESRTCGWPMLGIAIGLIALGIFAIQRIVDIEI